jgi:hypothetical protein
MIEAFAEKDPDSTVPRWFDWRDYCAAFGGDIVEYSLEIENAPDVSLVLSDDAREGNVVSFWIAGGTLDATYTIRCRVSLSNGIQDDWSKTQTISQR